ncbi:hypothetical protein CHS0354_022962 [Potamilus streckersoni]|uniref:Phytanoyl-CoA hydroxylase-interacting protein-like C-terminal domain-containing protein n=1 Tax=Potamilus streckersoni TaxID=2493646 RepID=A0AAE0VP97_9BIVA|nr:hypothetical protein CHS0354_022962 [Potamilus streckersoni]
MQTTELVFSGQKQKIKVKWGEFHPEYIYLVLLEQTVVTKRCLHWIMDICYTAAIPLKFLSYPCIYNIMVCGLNSVKAGSEVYYEVCGTAKFFISDARESMEIDLEVKDTPWVEDVDTQFTTKESFMLNINHSPPSTYTLHQLPKPGLNQLYLIHIHQEFPRKDLLFLLLAPKKDFYTFPVKFVPASDYVVTVFIGKTTQIGMIYETCSVSRPRHFRAYMTQQEVTELLIKGETFARQQNTNFVQISYLYRNKWPQYYNTVLLLCDGIMYKYPKNWTGDKASTLHRNLNGLFFSANIDFKTGAPPECSFYGPVRLNIPAIHFLQPDKNLYFADFYCHYTNHKVMLVVTEKGEDSDKWCNSRLVQLNQFGNPFLFRTLDGQVYVTKGITVELFYTENINVGFLLQYAGAFFYCVTPIGDARHTVLGIPKNPNCNICKLNHRKSKEKQDENNFQTITTQTVDQLSNLVTQMSF